MTVQALRGVGLVARMTASGDWAFDYALDLATEHDVQLDIFFFPTPPGQAHAARGRRGETAELSEAEKLHLEREVRLYYDGLLGDFEKVGFRLCEGDEDPELRRCLLVRKEYDVLVIPYEGFHSSFGERTVEDFAESMPWPTALGAPESARQFFVNSPATLWIESLGLEHAPWSRVTTMT